MSQQVNFSATTSVASQTATFMKTGTSSSSTWSLTSKSPNTSSVSTTAKYTFASPLPKLSVIESISFTYNDGTSRYKINGNDVNSSTSYSASGINSLLTALKNDMNTVLQTDALEDFSLVFYYTPTLTYSSSSGTTGSTVSKTFSKVFSVSEVNIVYMCGDSGTLNSTTISALPSTSTITIDASNSSYTHKVEWMSGTSVIATRSLAAGVTTASYSIPATAYSYCDSDATSFVITCVLTTYDENSNEIGSQSYPITVTLSSSAGAPTINSGSLAYVKAWSTGTTVSTAYTNYTKPRIAFSYTLKYNAVLTNYKILENSEVKSSVTLEDGASSSIYTSGSYLYLDSFVSSGSKVYSIELTDSRGFTASYTFSSITVVAAAKPTISIVTKRCNSSGTAALAGAYISLVSTVTQNAYTSVLGISGGTYTIKYKEVGSSSSETSCSVNSSNVLIDSSSSSAISFDIGKDYLITVTFTESNSTFACTASATVSKATCAMHITNSGYGVGIGDFCDSDKGTSSSNPQFKCAYPMYINLGTYASPQYYQMRITTDTTDTGLAGYITFIVES